jgi:hypothetical protein
MKAILQHLLCEVIVEGAQINSMADLRGIGPPQALHVELSLRLELQYI